MFKGLKQGIGIALGIVLTCGVFAFTVSGSIKTWTAGETLTATDLNQNVQSLKAAIEAASQKAEASVQGGGTTLNYRTLLGTTDSTVETGTTMTRSGTVSNASLIIATNTVGANCTVTLRKNSADTLISFSIPSGSTTKVTDSDTVSYISGDILDWKTSCTSGTTNNLYAAAHFEF